MHSLSADIALSGERFPQAGCLCDVCCIARDKVAAFYRDLDIELAALAPQVGTGFRSHPLSCSCDACRWYRKPRVSVPPDSSYKDL